ncbi:MAG: homoserine kinase [Bacteroidales bacterium]
MREIRVFSPASVSNVACGFDVMGFAIEQLGDQLVMRKSNKKGVIISKITGDGGILPYNVEANTAGKPLLSMSKKYSIEEGIEIEIHKKMPFGSGLGSSAASAVAAVYAFNKLFNLSLTKRELLKYALEGEEVASGAIHADNVAPSLYGGFVLIRGYNPIDIIEIATPPQLYCVVVHPQIEIKTKESRKILPKEIPLKDAVTQWGNTAALTAGLLTEDYNLISRSLQDVVIEPHRAHTIPGLHSIKSAAMANKALGCSISGSGPSIFALSKGERDANRVGEAMYKAMLESGLKGTLYISKISKKGPQVLESR